MPVSINNPANQALERILVYDIMVEGEEMNLSTSEIKKVDISNAEGSHEYALITTQLTKKQVDLFVDKMISFSFGRVTNNSTFYGYIVSITPNRGYQTDTIVDISCIGVTWPLQSGTPRFSRNITIPSMFSSVVTSHGLGCQVYSHSLVWPALAQTEGSDWEFLLDLAVRAGFAVYNYKGVVRLADPLRILRETPVFSQFIKGDDVLDKNRELLDWSPTTQSMNLRENLQPAFGFFTGGRPVVSQDRLVKPFKLMTDLPVTSRDMAESLVRAWNNRADYWNQQAEARIHGNAQLVPGINVAIQASPKPVPANEYDGVWLVRKVQHSLTHNSFQTQISLSRDTLTTPMVPVNPQFRWFWNASSGSPRVIKDDVNKKWRSSWGTRVDVVDAASI